MQYAKSLPCCECETFTVEAALGVDAEPLIRLQVRYNMRMTRKDKSFMRKLDAIRKVAAML